MADITQLKTSVFVADSDIPLNRFTHVYVGNEVRGIVRALGQDAKDITININGADIKIFTEEGEVSLHKDFARKIVEGSLKGILSPLKGIDWNKQITIKCKGKYT